MGGYFGYKAKHGSYLPDSTTKQNDKHNRARFCPSYKRISLSPGRDKRFANRRSFFFVATMNIFIASYKSINHSEGVILREFQYPATSQQLLVHPLVRCLFLDCVGNSRCRRTKFFLLSALFMRLPFLSHFLPSENGFSGSRAMQGGLKLIGR